MKNFTLLLVFLFFNTAFCQQSSVLHAIHITIQDTAQKAASRYELSDTFGLKKQGSIDSVKTDFVLQAIPGIYYLKIDGYAANKIFIRVIDLDSDTNIVVDFINGYPCPYSFKNKCPIGSEHKDQRMYIAYGLGASLYKYKKLLFVRYKKRLTNGIDFIEGGCVITQCDPPYYCRRHQIEF